MRLNALHSAIFLAFMVTSAFSAPDLIIQDVTYNEETVTMRLFREDLRGENFELWSQIATGEFSPVTPVTERSYLGSVDGYPGAVSCGVQLDNGNFKGAIFFNRGATWMTLGNTVVKARALNYNNFTNYQFPTASTVTPGQGGSNMYAFDLGVDADHEYFTDAQSDLAAVLERIEYSIAVTRAIYMRDALIRPYLGRVIIRSTLEHDPYSGLSNRDFLDVIRTEWNNNHSDANRDTVAGVAGRGAGSGIAWPGQIGSSYGYSVNGSNSAGEFEGVFRHELGHNWDCGHYVGGSPEGTGLMGGNSAGRLTGCENYRVLRHRNEKAEDGIVDNEGRYTDIELPPYASLDAVELIRNLEGTTLFDETQQVKALVPLNDIGTTWQGGNEPFNDSSWRSGTNGVGYERNNGYEAYININVDTEMANHTGCYIRIPFDVSGVDLESWNYLALQMRYDDGFVAYLNGTRITSANDPETLNHLSAATETNDDSSAVTFENFNISAYLENLKPGQNILAIHALNESTGSSDFLNQARLVAGVDTGMPINPVMIDVLANDHDANGQNINLSSFDNVTAEGGRVLRQGQSLIYTAPPAMTDLDWFNYTISDTSGRTAEGVVVIKPKIILLTLILSPSGSSIPATGGNVTFNVSSNTSWNWSDNALWLTSNEATTQSGNQVFSYAVAANTSTQSRSATITLTTGDITRTHTLTQEGAVADTLVLSPISLSINAGSDNITFNVSSNTTWSWSDNATWLTSNEPATQSGNQAFSYAVAANTSTQSRSATITLTAGNITRTHTLTQEGAADTLTFRITTAITMQENGKIDQFILSFPASSTATYSIEASADLKAWATLEASIAGNGKMIERSYPAVGALQRFGYFRVRRE